MNDEQVVIEIRSLAHQIDNSVNLFEGFSKKKENGKKEENLFWRQVVNIYSIFCDCDKVQLKEKENAFELFQRYGLISREDYKKVKKLYSDISNLRGWFCHNNNTKLLYAEQKKIYIDDFIEKCFLFASRKPKNIESVEGQDWEILNYSISNRYVEYLEILKMALRKWNVSADRKQIIGEWKVIYAKALFNDKELIRNILAEKAKYLEIDMGVKRINIKKLEDQLSSNSYSYSNLLDAINFFTNETKSAIDIVYQSMEYIDFII